MDFSISPPRMKTSRMYCIKRSYRHRETYVHFDDTHLKDEWQREVYVYAEHLMKQKNHRSVVDIGCGSAFKLLTYLGEFETLGVEVSPTYEWLLRRYPDRRWAKSDFRTLENLSADLVICADVIEHLIDPDELLSLIQRIECENIILSTPDRNRMYRLWNRGRRGPPANPHHIREWSFDEFRRYVSQSFDVVFHAITNRKQATQMIVCRNRPESPLFRSL